MDETDILEVLLNIPASMQNGYDLLHGNAPPFLSNCGEMIGLLRRLGLIYMDWGCLKRTPTGDLVVSLSIGNNSAPEPTR